MLKVMGWGSWKEIIWDLFCYLISSSSFRLNKIRLVRGILRNIPIAHWVVMQGVEKYRWLKEVEAKGKKECRYGQTFFFLRVITPILLLAVTQLSPDSSSCAEI